MVTDDRRGAAEELALRRPLSAEEILDSPFLLIGTHDQMAEALVGRRERYGISYWVGLRAGDGGTGSRCEAAA